jgi:6-pyruvoyltetrahydropterin/6-carboxytetrahydropterin synthase
MSSFSLKKRFTFEAAHFLPHHDGKCKRLHGHSWVGWVEVEGKALQDSGPESGMVIDFGRLSCALKPLLDGFLDHHLLNETLGLVSPTAEAIARWVFEQLREGGLPISSVTIEETCTSVCTYQE